MALTQRLLERLLSRTSSSWTAVPVGVLLCFWLFVLWMKMNSNSQQLLDLVQEYEAAGWLNSKQAYEYTRLLQKHPESQEYIGKEIQKAVKSAVPSVKPILHQAKNHPRHRGVSWEDDKTRKKLAFENADPSLCLEPAELKKALQENTNALKELFAEMCFFARLGFVQPPCCLRCTYNEAIERRAVHATCQRWVVWRKQADISLHPDTLGDNIVMFQCHAVRKLLTGKPVAGRVWDTKIKQLVVQAK